MKIRSLVFCLSLFFTFSKASFAVDNAINYDNIGKAVAGLYTKTGSVTQEEYDSFWNEVGAKDKASKEKIISFVKNNLLLMQDYQREAWKCAEIAWNLQKVADCPNLQKKYSAIESGFKKNNQENQLKAIKEFSTKIIEAAAKRDSMKSESGVEMPLSLEMIQMMGRNLDGLFARFDSVLKTNY